MKRIVSVIVVLLVLFQLKGQNNMALDSMLILSVESYIDSKDLDGISVQDTDPLYICEDGFPFLFPFESMQNVTFVSLRNVRGLPFFMRCKLRKGMGFLFVAIEVSKNQIVISVSGREVKLVKIKNLEIGIVDSLISFYEYSFETQKWELKETQFSWI